MNFIKSAFVTGLGREALVGLLLMATLVTPELVLAGPTDISNTPIARTRTATVKPNIMVLMDTSNSMAWTHMPDEMEGTSLIPPDAMPGGVGYRSAQCNALYYNPLTKYELPVDGSGARITTSPSFTAARYDVYSTTVTDTRNLETQFQAYDSKTRRKTNPSGSPTPQTANGISYLPNEDTPQAAYYWVYAGTATLKYDTRPCTLPVIGNSITVSAGDGGGTWTKVVVSSTSGNATAIGTADERTNFAIWYTYYRTRMALTKSAVGLAFLPVSDTNRVGLISMNPGTPVASTKYEALGDFDVSKRAAWFTKLQAQIAESSSPAREALARVGRGFASKTDGINQGMTDPNPNNYSCQQNFTIMTTDGYWNTAAETEGPVKLDYLTRSGMDRWVGRQDNTLTGTSGDSPFPIWDGGLGGSRVKTDMSNTYSYAACATGLFNRTVDRISKTTTVTNQTTSQTFKSTAQRRATTFQTQRTVSQTTRTATRRLKTQTQQVQSRTQWQETSTQNRQQDAWRERLDRTVTRREYQTARSDLQLSRTDAQTLRKVTQQNQVTYKTERWTTTVTRSSSQTQQTTTVWPRTPYQTAKTTRVVDKSTSQTFKTQTRALATTVQIFEYNGATEQTRAVASCTSGGNISCATETYTDVRVEQCDVDIPPDASNNYVRTTCRTETLFARAAVTPTDCTANVAPTSGNNYIKTVCETIAAGPTRVDPATCVSSSGPTSGNSYVTTTCTPTVVGPTFVDVAAVGTNCPAGTSATAVGTWTTNAAVGNSWMRTVCQTTTAAAVNGPAAGCVASSLGAGPSYITNTCAPSVTGPVGVSACTVNDGTASPYTKVDCPTTNPGTQGLITPNTATITASATTTGCPAGTSLTTAGTYTQSANSGNSFIAITCTVAISGKTVVNPTGGTCPAGMLATTAESRTSVSGTTRTDCQTSVNTALAPVASCTDGTTAGTFPTWITSVCSTATTTAEVAINPTTVGSVCPAGTSTTANDTKTSQSGTSPFSTTTCRTVITGPTYYNQTTVPAGCPGTLSLTSSDTKSTTPSASSWITTTCSSVVSGGATNYVNPTTCPGANATTPGTNATYASNTRTTCTTTLNTFNTVSPATCPAGVNGTSAGNSGNGWKTIACNETDTVAVRVNPATCPLGSTTVGNTTTICRDVTDIVRFVGTCNVVTTPLLSNNWTTTTCPAPVVSTRFISPCNTQTANVGNNWTTLSCAKTIDEVNIPVNSCTDAPAAIGNNYTATVCTTNSYGGFTNTPVDPATCVADLDVATDLNGKVRTVCATSTAGMGVQGPIDPSTIGATCPAGATANAAGTWTDGPVGPNWISRSCTTTLPAATFVDRDNVASCPAGTTTTAGLVTTVTRAAAAGNSWVRIACATTQLDATPVPVNPTTCTANVAANAGNGWIRKDCSDNNTASTAVEASTCTAPFTAANIGNNWTATTCSTTTTGPTAVNPATCTSGTDANWLTTTCTPVVTGPLPGTSCQASAAQSPDWVAVDCNTSTTGPDQVSTCTPSSVVDGVFQVITTCADVPGSKIQYTPRRSVVTEVLSGSVVVSSSGPFFTDGTTGDVNGICQPDASRPPLPNPNPKRPTASELPLPDIAGCTAWPCTQTYESVTGGSMNSLADVAQYYYVTDLRPDLANDVATIGEGAEDDRKKSQHMTTYVLGLGVSGTLNYSNTYRSDSSGNFAELRAGTRNWPAWPSPDTVAFPQAANGNYNDQLLYNDPRSIDDFWHTAVNGRGQYFSAKSPATVVKSLQDALSSIKGLSGVGTGASTSTLVPIEGDNFSFIASYTTDTWTGDVKAYELSIESGARGDEKWSAQLKLQSQVSDACDDRNIYVMGTGNLRTFTLNSTACTGGAVTTQLTATEQAYFDQSAIETLVQYQPVANAYTASATQKAAASGANLVNFIRGQRQYEGVLPNNAKLYRERKFVLGDIVNSQPIYVPEPRQGYGDEGYLSWKNSMSTRMPMLYVGGNDGMLHAFYAPRPTDTANAGLAGKEAWAVIPTTVMPNLVTLADAEYSARHKWYVDGSGVSGDAYDSVAGSWKTILVGGLGAGGKSFYALDVTDPTLPPKGLWEFKAGNTCYDASNPATATTGSDCHLGYSFGRPIITKIEKSGGGTQWVVMLTSGYNNVRATPGTGDGGGYLYVLDAFTGKILYKIATGQGDADTPSGLREINTYVANFAADNLTQRVYGADVLGNVFRFDVNDNLAPTGREAVLIGSAKDADGKAQPITTRPVLSEYTGKTIVVVGTGRLLGVSDLNDESVQSVYSFVDPLSSTTAFSSFRTLLKPMALTQVIATGDVRTRTIECSATGTTEEITSTCNQPLGWYVDLPETKERVNIDMATNSGTIAIVSNVPSATDCNPSGHAWLMQLDILNGKALDGTAATYVQSMIAGIGLLGTTQGTKINQTKTDGSSTQDELKKKTPPPAGKRISWREIGR